MSATTSVASLPLPSTTGSPLRLLPLPSRVTPLVVILVGISITSACFIQRISNVDLFSRHGLSSITPAKWLMIALLIDAYLFLFITGVLSRGIVLGISDYACSLAENTCVSFYFAAKPLLYFVLLEKVYAVWPNRQSRFKSGPYIIGSSAVLGFVVVLVLGVKYRHSYVRADGECIIGFGMDRTITLIILFVDLAINLILTTLFVIPLWSHRMSPNVRKVATKNLIASIISTVTSATNLGIVAAFHSRELAWVCLTCCSVDVTINVLAAFWVTKPQSTHSRTNTSYSSGATRRRPGLEQTGASITAHRAGGKSVDWKFGDEEDGYENGVHAAWGRIGGTRNFAPWSGRAEETSYSSFQSAREALDMIGSSKDDQVEIRELEYRGGIVGDDVERDDKKKKRVSINFPPPIRPRRVSKASVWSQYIDNGQTSSSRKNLNPSGDPNVNGHIGRGRSVSLLSPRPIRPISPSLFISAGRSSTSANPPSSSTFDTSTFGTSRESAGNGVPHIEDRPPSTFDALWGMEEGIYDTPDIIGSGFGGVPCRRESLGGTVWNNDRLKNASGPGGIGVFVTIQNDVMSEEEWDNDDDWGYGKEEEVKSQVGEEGEFEDGVGIAK